MRKCVFLSMNAADLKAFVSSDTFVEKPLKQKGWTVDTLSWRNFSINWNLYDLVIIRSTWDYQDEPELFFSQLQNIENSSAILENPLNIIKWNIDKTYLRDLENSGIAIVPTVWYDSLKIDDLSTAFSHFNSSEIIIKPTISANADNTFRIQPNALADLIPTLKTVFKNKNYMVQPFIETVVNIGEYSLFYFSGEYSHAILKTPGKGDFRVQEEHGGILKAIQPTELLKNTAENILKKIPQTVLYARVDLVLNDTKDTAMLMELELIEPSLYFNFDDSAAERFATAIVNRLQ